MKPFMILLLIAAQLRAQGIASYGFTSVTSASASTTQAMNAAANWVIWRHIPESSKTLSKYKFYASAVAGTLGSSDIRVEVLRLTGIAWNSTVTYTDGSDIVNLTAHPFTNGDRVAFAQTGGALPAGIANDTTLYYVCSANANDFQIDDNSNCGSPVTDFSGASGTNMVRWVIDTTTTVTSTPTGAAWVEATGLTSAVTRSVPYGFLVRNVNGTPASNNFTIRSLVSGTYPYSSFGVPPSSNRHSPSNIAFVSTNSGSTPASAMQGGMRVEYSDGTFAGLPFENYVMDNSIASGDRVQGTTEIGVRYVLPASATVSVVGLGACYSKQGTVTANVVYKLYTGANGAESLLATTDSIPLRNITSTSGCQESYFSSAQTITGGSVIRAMVAPSSSGDSAGNYYALPTLTIDNTAGSKALILGGAQHAKNAGGTWTYTDTKVSVVYLILAATPFQAQSSGGGAFGYVK